MTRVLLIGLAGAMGTLTRYFVALWASRTLGASFPYGTLFVNVAGCFLIALVSQLALSTPLISPTLKVTLTTGFMGGLTTYSSFNYEATSFLSERAWYTGLSYVALTVAGCFLSGWLGLVVARRLAGV